MELILGNQVTIEQTQKLTMNTEMIQSLNLLQFTSSELSDFIQEEMAENPLLDFSEEQSSLHYMVEADRIIDHDAEERDAEAALAQSGESGVGSDGESSEEYRQREIQEEYSEDLEEEYSGSYPDDDVGVSVDWQEYARSGSFGDDAFAEYDVWPEGGYGDGIGGYEDFGYNSYSSGYDHFGTYGSFGSYGGYDTAEQNYEFGVTTGITLEENLMSQLEEVCDVPYLTKATAAYIIQTLDENGYMTYTRREIASQLQIKESLVEEALRLIWTFDPPGVGAADLKECMKIQLGAIGRLDAKISILIDEHLEDIARGRFSAAAKAAEISEDEVIHAAELIRSLEPKPGRSYLPLETAGYIIPDVIVEKSNGKYSVRVNGHTAPKLIIRNDYRKMLRDSEKNSRVASFLSDRLNSAVWLIRNIQRRKETIERIVTALTEEQQEFFDKGRRYLKPLSMKQIGEKVGVHESTVSRTVNGKYLQCSQGVFELRYFFSGTSAFSGTDGQSATSEGLKALIAKLVENEDAAAPMSDRSIAEAILIKGIAVSRRTVAKYREELGIPSSAVRKRARR